MLSTVPFFKKRSLKNKKGGMQILLEFIFLIPFLLVLTLLLFDVLKFYYTYNVASFASYHAAYNFSMTTDVESSMDRGQEMLSLAGISEERFRDNSVVKADLYKYNRDNQSFGNFYSISEDKTSVSCYGEMVGLTCRGYDNERMLDREIWGVRFTVYNKLLSTSPLNTLSAGTIPEVVIPVQGYNHVFELQRYENES